HGQLHVLGVVAARRVVLNRQRSSFMSRNQRLAFLGVAVVVVVVAIVVIGSGGSDDNGADKTTSSATIVVQGGKPVGGVAHPVFKKGGRIKLTIQSDVADEVHFHGYDVHKDVA